MGDISCCNNIIKSIEVKDKPLIFNCGCFEILYSKLNDTIKIKSTKNNIIYTVILSASKKD